MLRSGSRRECRYLLRKHIFLKNNLLRLILQSLKDTKLASDSIKIRQSFNLVMIK